MQEIITCKSCRKETYADLAECPHCGHSFADTNSATSWAKWGREIETAKTSGDWSGIPDSILESLAKDVVVTTTPTIPGADIHQIIGIVTAAIIWEAGMFGPLLPGLTGHGDSERIRGAMRDMRSACLAELRREALIVGAKAVVSVGFSYAEVGAVTPAGTLVVANGTAVKLTGA